MISLAILTQYASYKKKMLSLGSAISVNGRSFYFSDSQLFIQLRWRDLHIITETWPGLAMKTQYVQKLEGYSLKLK